MFAAHETVSAMIDNIEDVVEFLGGTVAAGKLCGINPPAVSGWKSRGSIPPEHYFTITEALEAAGKPMPSKRLFGFPERVAAE